MKNPFSLLSKVTANLACTENMLSEIDASQPTLNAGIKKLLEQNQQTKEKFTLTLIRLTRQLLPLAVFIQKYKGNIIHYYINPNLHRKGIGDQETFYVDLKGEIRHVNVHDRANCAGYTAEICTVEKFAAQFDALSFCKEIMSNAQQSAEEDGRNALQIQVFINSISF